MKARRCVALLLGVLACSGCYTVGFNKEDTSWHYKVDGPKLDAGVVTVIPPEVVAQTYEFRSFLTGVANSWTVECGEMLQEVANLEIPQVVQYYQYSATYAEPRAGTPRLTLELSLPRYEFRDFQAILEVRVVAYRPGKVLVYDKTYHGEGETQGGKMFWAGAFGQKSAVRQSSLDAFRKAFTDVRRDLVAALTAPAAGGS